MANPTFQIRMTDTLREALEKRAAAFGVSSGDYVKALIIEDLKRALEKPKE